MVCCLWMMAICFYPSLDTRRFLKLIGFLDLLGPPLVGGRFHVVQQFRFSRPIFGYNRLAVFLNAYSLGCFILIKKIIALVVL